MPEWTPAEASAAAFAVATPVLQLVMYVAVALIGMALLREIGR